MDLLVKCPLHLNRFITNVYIRKDCPLKSRLVCNKCLHNNKELIDDFLDFGDFIEDPLNMLSIQKRTMGLFDELNLYFQRAQKDPMTIIDEYKQKINKSIEQLKQDLSKEIQELRNFQNQIKQTKTQFIEIIKHKQLKETFQSLIKIENYHSKQEWTEIQDRLQEYIKQFLIQDQNEIQKALQTLDSKDKDYFQGQVFTNFNNQTQEYYNELVKEMKCIGSSTSMRFSDLCRNINRQLMFTIDPNLKIQATLLFKGTQHGMNSSQFWSRCQNQGPTLTICKSANGTVFGGYTPCKWVANGAYAQDTTLKSFLFNANRREIYQNLNQTYSIYGNSSYGPTFGGGHDMQIAADFKSGYSNIGHSYKIENQDKIQNFNKSTHLMGDATPNLVEMEVFLIQQIQ